MKKQKQQPNGELIEYLKKDVTRSFVRWLRTLIE